MAAQMNPTLIAIKNNAVTYWAFKSSLFAFLKATIEANMPVNQITNPDASGKATLWHGYVARLGFGITRIRNHISDISPIMGSIHLTQVYFLLEMMTLLVLGQILKALDFFCSDITPPQKGFAKELLCCVSLAENNFLLFCNKTPQQYKKINYGLIITLIRPGVNGLEMFDLFRFMFGIDIKKVFGN